MPETLRTFIAENKLLTLVGVYFVLSVFLNIATGIDIGIPCLWKSLLGIRCPGCGLTTALIHLLQLDFEKSAQSNWLIFLIIPLGIGILAKRLLASDENEG